MRRIISMSVLAGLFGLVSVAAGSVVSEPAPAFAAPCVLGNPTVQTWTPNPPTNNGVSRQGCWHVERQKKFGGGYRWLVRVQDTIDVCNAPSGCNRDGGRSIVQWRTPCAGCTNPWVNVVVDTNSADWNSVVYTSPWYDPVIHGPSTAWSFRFVGTTEFKNTFGQWVSGSTFTSSVLNGW